MVNRNAEKTLFVLVAVLLLQWVSAGVLTAAEPANIVQSGAILTVAESKRLIGKAVAQMPIVKNALASGMVIIIKGTTNAYVAEEITGQKADHAAFVTGRIEPEKAAKRLPPVKPVNHIILEKGKVVDIPLADAVKKLKAGDVVIKGANALDYKNKMAAINILDPSGGTTGITMPFIVARKAHLVIPVGLEKLVAGDIVDLTLKMREPVESLPVPAGPGSSLFPGHRIPSMWLVTGEIVTELEAIKMLTGATAFQSSAGGVSGAEGGVWLVFRGTREQVSNALKLVQSIQGEPPYTQ
ncbi:MAG: hypothetical protein A4E57_01628 [Syntrophorhabdaceae bacterium PtaU1.Bin034]|jgi:hypothetical protein|nr:MAG: hypothetical protein A4E57_01628 [Syntrophorhabdaceae bacterium PtaU1.Bin034]